MDSDTSNQQGWFKHVLTLLQIRDLGCLAPDLFFFPFSVATAISQMVLGVVHSTHKHKSYTHWDIKLKPPSQQPGWEKSFNFVLPPSKMISKKQI